MSENKDNKMEKIISLCKRRGFIYQGSEIYGGLAGTWDYGPLGVALKKNIENNVTKKKTAKDFVIKLIPKITPAIMDKSSLGFFANRMTKTANQIPCKESIESIKASLSENTK